MRQERRDRREATSVTRMGHLVIYRPRRVEKSPIPRRQSSGDLLARISVPPPAISTTSCNRYSIHTRLNSALHVFELNAICHFTREHHGTLFIAFSLRFGSPESLFFPYQFASSLFTVFSASLCEYQRGALDAATVITGSVLQETVINLQVCLSIP